MHIPAWKPPAPRGARVRYHGSLTDLHGEYLYDGPCACDEDEYCACCLYDLDRYQLAYDEPPGQDGTRRALLHVRRSSFTVIDRNEEP